MCFGWQLWLYVGKNKELFLYCGIELQILQLKCYTTRFLKFYVIFSHNHM